KYYLHGACLKGDSCQFSHSFDDPSSNVRLFDPNSICSWFFLGRFSSQICTFYQSGVCSYGSHCRYEHIRLSR
ncbi:hypothetical protein SELMODRAFT_19741, partial [Selaginella moellendorffii]